MKDITAERLRTLVAYDAETGAFTWRVSRTFKAVAGARAGYRRKDGYWVINLSGRCYLLHRLVWLYVTGGWPADMIDHINGDRGDNRLCNLRPASRSENMMNAGLSSTNSSGVKGVSFNRRENRWDAYIGLDRRRIKLGSYTCFADAVEARRQAEHRHFGAFARGMDMPGMVRRGAGQ